MTDDERLISIARAAQANAYAPYSRFKVGAAIAARSGAIFSGCNVENSSFGLSVCAERVAFFNAVSAGEREFVSLAVFSETSPPAKPCGACLQVLYEFNPELRVICAGSSNVVQEFELRQLLPEGFRLE